MSDFGGRPFYIATAGNLGIGGANSGTRLYSINVNTGAASAVFTVYDGTSASGKKFATIDASAKGSYVYGGVVLKDGFFGVLSGANADITVNAA